MHQNKISHGRRYLIKSGAKLAAGMIMLPAVLRHEFNSRTSIKKDGYVYRTLGRTGLRIPIVSLGGPEGAALINNALDRGIVHINTSPEYRKGSQEIQIGKTLQNRKRDSFVIATGFYMGKKPQNQIKHFTMEDIVNSFQASLKRLNLDYVDIYYLMGVAGRETVLYPAFKEVMEAFKKSGKARFIGVTTHQNESEILEAAIDGKIYDVVLTAYNFRKIYREEIKKAMAAAATVGIGIVAMKTQAGVYWDYQTKEMINMKAALKWVLQDENVHTAIPEFATIEELNTGISVMENLDLTPKEKKDLRLEDGLSQSMLFCQHCHKCNAQCRGDFDIPTLMRGYMYAHGYRNIPKAKETIAHIHTSQIICKDCSSCTVQCTMGFKVKARITDLLRLRNIPDDFLA